MVLPEPLSHSWETSCLILVLSWTIISLMDSWDTTCLILVLPWTKQSHFNSDSQDVSNTFQNLYLTFKSFCWDKQMVLPQTEMIWKRGFPVNISRNEWVSRSYVTSLASFPCGLLRDIYNKKVVSPRGAFPYCLFPGCFVTWAWSLTRGQYIWFHDFWLAHLEQRYWQNRETANIGLASSVGRAPARQSMGRRFKSRSSQFFFVRPTQNILLLVLSVGDYNEISPRF